MSSLKFKFNIKYFFIAVVLFIIEVLIAIYVHDEIIRPYVGDVIVVILIYCFVKAFINAPVLTTAIATLVFSFLTETLQYFQFVELIGLKDSKLANIVIGNYFAWNDLLAYTIGFVIILIAERNHINDRHG